jgi:hypothetical protein
MYTKDDFEFFKNEYRLEGLEYYKLKAAKPHSGEVSYKTFKAAADKERSEAYKQIRVEHGKLVLDVSKLKQHISSEISQGRYVSLEEKGNGVHVIVYLEKISVEDNGHVCFKAIKVEGKRGSWGEDHARTDNWASVVKCYVDTFNFALPIEALKTCFGELPSNLYAQAELMSARTSHYAISHYLGKFNNATASEKINIVKEMHLQFFSLGLYIPGSPFEDDTNKLQRVSLKHCRQLLSHWEGKEYSAPTYLRCTEPFRFRLMPSVQFCDSFNEKEELELDKFILECQKRNGVLDDGLEGYVLKSGKDDITQDKNWKCKWMYKANEGILVLPGPNNKLLVFRRPGSKFPEGFFCCPPKEPERNPNVGHFIAVTQYKLINDPDRSELKVTGMGPIKWDALESFLLLFNTYSDQILHCTTEGGKDGRMTQLICSRSATEFWVPLSEVGDPKEYEFLVLDLNIFQKMTDCTPVICYALNQLVHAPGTHEYRFDTNVCYGLHVADYLLEENPQALKECMDSTQPLNFRTKCLMKSYTVRIPVESEGWNREKVSLFIKESITNPHKGPDHLTRVRFCQVMQTLNNCFRAHGLKRPASLDHETTQQKKISIPPRTLNMASLYVQQKTIQPILSTTPVATPRPLMTPPRVFNPQSVAQPIPVATSHPVSQPIPVATSRPVSQPIPVATSRPLMTPPRVFKAHSVAQPIPVATPRPVSQPTPMATQRPLMTPPRNFKTL